MVTAKFLLGLTGLLKVPERLCPPRPMQLLFVLNKCTFTCSCSTNRRILSLRNWDRPLQLARAHNFYACLNGLSGLIRSSSPSFLKTNIMSLGTDATVLRHEEAVEEDEKKAFDDVFPIIVEKVKKTLEYGNLHEVAKWFEEVLYYNVPHGKKNRGMAVVNSFKILVNDMNRQQLHNARIVGWCLEMVQACFLISDDMMDHSLTRRGQACWYKKEGVGMMAINDAILMHACIYQVLDFIQDKKCSSDLQKCFNDVIWKTASGQCLDMLSAQKSGRPDLNKYTEDRYALIIKFKTAYYTICLPVHLSLVLAGMNGTYKSSVEDLLLSIGHFFQVQDDYLDCFGDPEITGKVGTDIEDGKCCWPIVMALERVSDEDRSILEANYGVSSAESVKKVREIYKQIGLQDVYNQYEVNAYKNLCQKIEEVSRDNNIPPALFYDILNVIYKRIK